MKSIIYFYIILLLTIMLCRVGMAQVGVGVDLTPSYGGSSKKKDDKKKKLKNPFVFHFCNIFNQDYIIIRKLQKNGYGRMELIKVLLITQNAGVALKKVIKDRNKLIPLRKIAEKYDLDYRKIRSESVQFKKQIEKRIVEIPVTEEEPTLQNESRLRKDTKNEK